jgi:tetratricopeptide (TPR) repeat protein
MADRLAWRLRAVASILAPFALAACQPQQKAVSLEEAKKVTASFEGQGFTPPPRTIADITAILDQQKPDPAKAAANRAAADAQPPAGADPATLARFYSARGLAAAELGRTEQRLADYREAVRFGREGGVDVSRSLEALVQAEMTAGNQRTAHEIAQQVLDMVKDPNGQSLGSLGIMSRIELNLGNIAAAEQSLNRAQALLDQLPSTSKRGYPVFGDHWHSLVEFPRAQLLRETGRYAEAESTVRLAIAHEERAIPRYDQMAATTSITMFPRGNMERAAELYRSDLALSAGLPSSCSSRGATPRRRRWPRQGSTSTPAPAPAPARSASAAR